MRNRITLAHRLLVSYLLAGKLPKIVRSMEYEIHIIPRRAAATVAP